MLRIKGLVKRFGSQTVLDGIDLDLPDGRLITIIGKSGVGKSVLLKCIAGLLEPNEGTISFDGHGGERPELSYMFQGNALFDYLNAFDNVALPLREKERLPPKEVKNRVLALFERLDLKNMAEKFPSELSGGMQKRVAFARALVTEPSLVLFDEPTTGLDPARKTSVFRMIEEHQAKFGFTALLVSHDLPDVLYLSDRIAILENGGIAFNGTPMEFEASHGPVRDRYYVDSSFVSRTLLGLASNPAQPEGHPLDIEVKASDSLKISLGPIAIHQMLDAILKASNENNSLRWAWEEESVLRVYGQTPWSEEVIHTFREKILTPAATHWAKRQSKVSPEAVLQSWTCRIPEPLPSSS